MASSRMWATFSFEMALLSGALLLTLLVLFVVWARLRALGKTVQAASVALAAVGRGDLEVELPAHGKGVAAQLGRSFNDAVQRLHETHKQLAAYQRTLEERVKERTRELNEATARAVQMAQTDPLTHLPNRLLFSRALEEALRKAASRVGKLAVLFVDLDHFKVFNDTYGHERGDRLLRTVATRLVESVRSDDMVARLGGDEFVILLRHLEGPGAEAMAERIAAKVLAAIREPIDLGMPPFEAQASIGLAVYPRDGRTAAELLRNAGAAMYAAKQSGRGRIETYSSDLAQRQAERAKREAAIREGLDRSEFFLVFQPQLDCVTGLPSGVEALLRWNQLGRGVVPPSEFIATAEAIGLIGALGQRALELACAQVREWQRCDLYARIAVNVSVKQMEDPDWFDSVQSTIEEFGVSPRYIDLEITESTLVGNPQRVIDVLNRLSRLGVTLTLDDFGTGYSSLSYLAQLPFNTVKIDRSFTGALDRREQRSVAQAIVALAHSLGMRVIAEGVETPQQMAIVRELGVEEMQGFYLAQPMPAEQIPQWWQQQMANARVLLEARGLAP
ncbi:MAG: EAL domain-containing protein [Casimicrobiaceae bacterium]|nr:EAL domain-containing protein [Casimicrobiaceae bacterium]